MGEDLLEQLERPWVSVIDQPTRPRQGSHLPGLDSLDQRRQVTQGHLLELVGDAGFEPATYSV